MARRNVYLPDHLDRRLEAELPPDENLSAIVQLALTARLDRPHCRHEAHAAVRCPHCLELLPLSVTA